MTILENLVYDDQTGVRGLYDMILPCEDGGSADTLFFYIHGGGIEGGSKNDNRETFRILAEHGIACASINYRMFPDGAKYPMFIEDCARAVHAVMTDGRKHCDFKKIIVGGSSAGGYLSMMMFYNPAFLGVWGIKPTDIDGWFFDAGQPTAHFGILQRNGFDPLVVRVDETAPMYYITEKYEDHGELPRLHFIWSEFDMTLRPEQNALMVKMMEAFGYPKEKLSTRFMPGMRHCQYVADAPLFASMIEEFVHSKA